MKTTSIHFMRILRLSFCGYLLLATIIYHRLPAQSTQKLCVQEDQVDLGEVNCWERLFTPTVTTICLDPHKPTIVSGQSGVETLVNSDDFAHADGSPIQGAVEFRMTEVMDKAGMILGNLPTVSDGKILESAGVVRLEAFADGKPLILAPGKSVPLRFPKGNQAGMQLFEGTHSNASGNDMNWKTMPSAFVPSNSNGRRGFAFSFEEGNHLKRITPYMDEGLSHPRKLRFQNSGKSILAYLQKEVATNYPCFGKGKFMVKLQTDGKGLAKQISIHTSDDECLALALLETVSRLKWNTKWRFKYDGSFSINLVVPFRGRKGAGVFVSVADNPKVTLDKSSKSALKELHALRKEREEELKKRQFGDYAMRTTKLGWINCDRFTNWKPLISMTVSKAAHYPNTQSYLVIDEYNCVMASQGTINGEILFTGIPPGIKARVVSMAYDKTLGPQLAILPLTTKAGKAGTLELLPVSEAALKEKLEAL